MSKKKTILDKIEPLQDIEAIQKLLKEMKVLCLKAGITEKAYKSILKVDKENSEEQLKERRTFLIALYKGPYNDYRTAYNHVPEYVWDNYKLRGTKDLPEQIILEDRAKILRTAWKIRPKRLKSKKESIEEETVEKETNENNS